MFFPSAHIQHRSDVPLSKLRGHKHQPQPIILWGDTWWWHCSRTVSATHHNNCEDTTWGTWQSSQNTHLASKRPRSKPEWAKWDWKFTVRGVMLAWGVFPSFFFVCDDVWVDYMSQGTSTWTPGPRVLHWNIVLSPWSVSSAHLSVV